MCEKEKKSLKDWKPESVTGDLSKYIADEIYPEEITIRIHKEGSVILLIGDVCIGQVSKLVLEAGVDAVVGNVSKFHIEQFSIDVSEDGEEYVKVLHEFDGVSEFIFGQKRINLIEDQLEQNREGVDDDN